MKTRIIQTRFWEDSFISSLPPKSKLVFIYLLTNPRLELTGAYEVTVAHIALDTGLTQVEVQRALEDVAPKIVHLDGYAVVLNHKKYQDYEKGNDRQRAAYERELDRLPESVKSLLLQGIGLVPDQSPTSPGLDRKQKVEIRNKKEGGVGETKPLDSSPAYLTSLPSSDLEELAEKFQLQSASIERKAEQLYHWYQSNPQKNKRSSWKSVLRNALDRDQDELRSKEPKKVIDLDAIRAEREARELREQKGAHHA
jgi:hypothetical protein